MAPDGAETDREAGGEADGERVLICSTRPEICRSLTEEFRRLPARPEVAGCREEWPEEAPSVVVVDLAGSGPPVREACLQFGGDAELWALADQESADRLVPALAAGCVEYLFYPVNRDELRLRWRKHRMERRDAPDPASFSGELRLQFPSDVRYVGPAVRQVVGACEGLALPGSRATLNLRVSVGEAVSNAILYGNREDPEKKVTIRARFAEDAVRVTVRDEGEGFDPGRVADPTRPENRNRTHGRGLFLLRSLMDEVRYNDRGNEVTLVLHC